MPSNSQVALPGARAIARHVRLSPMKARRMVNLVRGLSAKEALTVLQFAGGGATPDSSSSDWLITLSTYLQHGAPLYLALYAGGIIFFCFFYTAVQFNSEETAENLKKHGGFIPGIRPGKATEQYFDYLLNRITVIGAAYLTTICLIPEIALSQAGVPFYLGGTSLLIVVNVTMDTVSQIQSHLIAHQYGDLIKKAKLKGARRR